MANCPSSHVALVTGASLGIGAATAREFARRGAKVAVHYNSSEDLAESDEVAKVIAFLASEEASLVLGESIRVNTGMLMDLS